MPVAIHTIGDLSLEYVIDALELYPPAKGLRDRIIHCQLAREELIERMKNLPAIIDIQPVFLSSDFPSVIEKLESVVFVMRMLGRRYWKQDYTATVVQMLLLNK